MVSAGKRGANRLMSRPIVRFQRGTSWPGSSAALDRIRPASLRFSARSAT
jgi:hypothetical protein